jgi:hypothetical protein
MIDTPVPIPLRRKYTARKTVKQVSAKNGGNTGSTLTDRHKYLPRTKGTHQNTTPPTLILDLTTGKRRWVRG